MSITASLNGTVLGEKDWFIFLDDTST